MSLFLFGSSSAVITLWTYAEGGSFEFVKKIPSERPCGVDGPTWIVQSDCGGFVYCVNEEDRSVSSFKVIRDEGVLQDLELLTTVRSEGGAPCHASLSADGRHFLVANYSSGTLTLAPRGEEGSLLPPTQVIDHNPEGVADQAHAHFISRGTHGQPNVFYCCDLGMDIVYTYELQSSSLVERGRLVLPVGSGPRHCAFHLTAPFVYIVNELSNTVCVATLDEASGCLVRYDDLQSTLPDGESGSFGAAEILLSHNCRFVYVSNRCIDEVGNAPARNTVAVFEVLDHGQRLRKIQTFSTQGIHPRHMCLACGDTRLIVANKLSNNVVSFHVNVETGAVDEASAVITDTAGLCDNISYVHSCV